MKPATVEFLRNRFSDYYSGSLKMTAPLRVPEALDSREWGFMFFGTRNTPGMRRHLSFPSKDELFSYLGSMTPAHVYYSTAYYEHPAAPTMDDKGWSGADVIFDLDADHIMRGPYDRMLSRVKEELFKLIDMLTSECGVDPAKDLSIVFSGGRGYHIHLHSLAMRSWKSGERRELVNYVCGTGLSPSVHLADPDRSDRGWRLRLKDAIKATLAEIRVLPADDQVKALSSVKGVSASGAVEFQKRLDRMIRSVEAGDYRPSLHDRVIQAMFEDTDSLLTKHIRNRAVLADEPVTTDIKRLIRHPSSLHGGSGFLVTPLDLRDLDSFDPLIDAVVFSERPVRINSSFETTMPILGNTYTISKGVNTVPEALGVFLCARGIADFEGGFG
ncbi:DNA primase catalytic subunit PriS [Methanocalculus taiwanensis]|uniref:DNA primase small subunit PriS n=1 Tax=Methanocalculus taiwanensis TaxID=106207 RepID=A0ABD4TJQ6_9EURY|nr:DNA primase catalytic subunit PriS [Methanocalculus taiwanensis]MCQ1539149.1 DNA primase catalytic subunit PriS [Methanocalculus taiwanensis]